MLAFAGITQLIAIVSVALVPVVFVVRRPPKGSRSPPRPDDPGGRHANARPMSLLAPAAVDPPSPRCLVFREDAQPQHLTDLGAISDVLETSSLIWLDLVNPTVAEARILQEEFGLHPLSIEDATSHHELPKFEEYDQYLFVVVHGVTRRGETLTIHEMAVFVGERFVVTVRDEPAFPLDAIERRWRANDTNARHTSGTLLYYLLDAVVDGYAAVGDVVIARVEALEDRLFGTSRRSANVFREIYQMKKETQRFRRSVAPMRDILAAIGRTNESRFGAVERTFLRDVVDHTHRVLEQIDGARDLLTSALDIHFSYNAQQQNDVAKQLTIVATIFLPLTYVTGFFGQNFGFLVGHIVDERAFWELGVGTEIVSILALFWWFRARGWL